MPPKKVYIKKDPISHILERSDMYTGSKKLRNIEEYVAIKNDEYNYKIIKKEINSSPAILRIFVEVLSNAIDNVERSKKAKIPCTTIKVVLDKETGETSVWNDGDIIPIEINEEEKIYNHSLIFGNLLTGSNYNDEEERLISGRNGLGSKLSNVFSKKFIVKGLDPNNKKVLEQTWTNNMRNTTEPKITDTKLIKGFTKVTYFPDFKQLGLEGYTQDIINLYSKYVIDAAMLTKVKVYLNDELIPVYDLVSYSKLYDSTTNENLLLKYSGSEVLVTPSDINEFQTISFVNGVYTRLGGVHADSWTETILRPIVEKFNKKDKKPQITIKDVKQFFRFFIVSTVINPEFSSQDKEKLEAPKIQSTIKSTEINKILKWSIIGELEDIIKLKEMSVLKKSEKKKKGYTKIEGMDHANNAGGKLGYQCSLILCEGLSAKTYAVAGIQKGVYDKKGRDWYGILCLSGKLLNCRNSALSTIANNKVITNLIQALGLRYDLDYKEDKNYKTLAYGKIIILTDADCFTDDTSLLIKKNNNISIVQIDSLFDNNLNLDTQIVNDTEVWDNNGWIPIKCIRQKKNTKRILTINTYSGIIRTTEDHTFLLEDGKEIKAKDIKIGDKLLRNRRLNKFPEYNINMTNENLKKIMKDLQIYGSSYYTSKNDIFEQIQNELNYCTEFNIPNKNEYFHISKDEAWFWGFFFADGTCGIYNFSKDREKQNKNNTEKSRLRWQKWIIKHSENVKKYEILLEELKSNKMKYGNISKKLRDSKKRLEQAIINSKRVSKELKPSLERISYSFNISNCDYEKLKLAHKIISEKYKYNWTINEVTVSENNQRSYRLILNGGKKVENFISTMRNRFYTTNKLKKVPDEILNNNIDIQKAFFNGYYDGDGFRWALENKNSEGFDILGQVGAQGLCYIVERLGYSYNIKEKNNKPNVFTINISKRYRRFYPGEVKFIYETEYIDRFIYDIETESGKINAGIGNMIQRQCDGIHISGLLMNFFHSLFPTLLEREDPFIVSMATPIVRVFNKGGDILFYDENRFRKFQDEQTKSFKSKYYKGLGSTKAEDVPDTFGMKMIEYKIDINTNKNMNKVFHKKFADTRKEWLENYDPNPTYSLDDEGELVDMDISNFLNNEVIKFSHDDCKRSIPSLFDGLKQSQRKVLYAVKKRGLTSTKQTLKVAQLGGYVAEHTNYHHGEQNLYDTIVKMAHDFVGSNNIPLLERDGMFGTRLADSGKDSASPRYIFTRMESITPYIFRDEDDILLEYIIDDGDQVEPKFYIPIIPMILVNGAKGIGSGWSSDVPNYNPLDIIECIKVWLDNDGEVIFNDPDDGTILSMLPEIKPWYRGFTGIIEESKNKYISYGKIEKNKDKIRVTELPIGMSTDKFKNKCEDWLVEKQIKSCKFYSTPDKIDFVITESDDGFSCNISNMGLHSYLHTTNMVMFNEKEQLRKYDVDDIINSFCIVRYSYYAKRKKHIINSLEKDLKYIGNKARFIKEIIEKKLNIMNIDEEIIIKELEKRGYDKEIKKDSDEEGGYNYLLSLHVRTFTANKIKQLNNDIANMKDKLGNIKATTEKQMWLNDLKEFENEYEKWLKKMENQKTKINKKNKK